MTRGYSLGQDLRLLLNNPKYSDIEIVCKDEKELHGCRAILAARSEVFDRLLYSRVGESYEKRISFSKINSSGMEVIMEYVYTGVVKEESLTKENIVDAFIAADYFQLPDLQEFIMKTVKNTLEKNRNDNYSPELLSKILDTIPLTEDNILSNLLVDAVSAIPLNTIELGRLSSKALRVLLSCTYEKDKFFVTPEYEVFRYSAILVASETSNDATKSLLNRLPTLEHMDKFKQIDNDLIPDHQKVAKELVPLIQFIDFRRIKSQILANIIEPLNIIPVETLLNVYRHRAMSYNADLNEVRGRLPVSNNTGFVWDESACGSNLIIEDDGKVVRASNACKGHQSVRAKVAFENQGIYEWDVIIEKHGGWDWVGVCASENFVYEKYVGYPTASIGWLLGSPGRIYHSKENYRDGYCPSFARENSKVTVHLDMNKRTVSFTVNDVKYPVVSEWKDLPSKLYPAVSLNYPSQFRIQFH